MTEIDIRLIFSSLESMGRIHIRDNAVMSTFVYQLHLAQEAALAGATPDPDFTDSGHIRRGCDISLPL